MFDDRMVIYSSFDPHLKKKYIGASCICYISGRTGLYDVILFSWLNRCVQGHELYYMSMLYNNTLFDTVYHVDALVDQT